MQRRRQLRPSLSRVASGTKPSAFTPVTGFNVPAHHLWAGVIFGAATSLLPWLLLLLPAFGWGWFGRRGPRGSKALLASKVSHTPYGLGVGVVMALGSSL